MSIKKRQRVLVRILNPIDSRTHTTMRAAADFVQRGLAVYEPGSGLRFVNDTRLRLSHQAVMQIAEQRREEAVLADRGGTIWWDGCTPGSKSTPFTAPVFHRPDQASRFRRALQLT
jgi:hypothetical protein